MIRHATPRTATIGDVAIYNSLYGPASRSPSRPTSSLAIGCRRSPLDSMYALPHGLRQDGAGYLFWNAIARSWLRRLPLRASRLSGDAITSTSEVIGLKENSNEETGAGTFAERGATRTADGHRTPAG